MCFINCRISFFLINFGVFVGFFLLIKPVVYTYLNEYYYECEILYANLCIDARLTIARTAKRVWINLEQRGYRLE